MINITGLVGKITGKTGVTADAAQGVGADGGVATGGDFAALVRLAAQAGNEGQPGTLKLVVDNSAEMPLPTLDAGLADGASKLLAGLPGDAQRALVLQKLQAAKPGTADADKLPEDPAAAVLVAATTPGEGEETTPGTELPVLSSGETDGDEATAGEGDGTPTTLTIPGAPIAVAPTPAAQAIAAQQAKPAEAPVVAVSGGKTDFGAKSRGVRADHAGKADRAVAGQDGASGYAKPADRAADPAFQVAALGSARDGGDQGTGNSGQSPAAPLSRGGEALAPSSSLSAIVSALPPVVQAELGAAPVNGVSEISTSTALGDKVIDMGVSGQWIDRVAQEIAGLAEGSGHSRFTLNPPHLGRLQVDLWQGDGATNVRMLTETDEAAQRLAEGRPALQADARIAALSFGTITVEKASAPFDTGTREQGQRQGSDLSGQMQQQAEGQAQSRAGNGQANGQGSDWLRRVGREEPNQDGQAVSRTGAQRPDGNVRFA